MDNPFDFDYVEPVACDDSENIAVTYGDAGTGKSAAIQRLASAVYHADPAPEASLSATLSKILLSKSPIHAWHASPRLNPDWEPVNKKTFDIGRAAHRAVLGCGDDYCAIPEDILASNGAASTKEAKAFIAAARDAGQTPLKADECEQIEAMREVAHARLREHGIVLDPARSELAAVAQVDGVWCRAMFDNVDADPRKPIYDFKTCEDASPEACLRAILNYGYDVQAEHYVAVWKAATGETRPFVFIFQEKSAPHEITLVQLSGSFREVAQRRAARARKLWADCTASNNWPGYPVGLHEVDAPAWFVERATEEAFA